MPSFGPAYRGFQRIAEEHSRAVLAIAAALFVATAAGLGALRLDMSFRPLFASGEAIALPTREFESVFGQSSGAWIAVVIENAGVSTAELLRTCARLSAEAAAVPGISEVHSLTSLSVPLWEGGRLAFVSPLPARCCARCASIRSRPGSRASS